MDLVWYMPWPWDLVVIVVVLTVASVVVFYLRFGAYHRRYFTDRALQLTALTTLAWLVVYGGAFMLVCGLTALFLPPGWLRIAVGSGVWWLLANTALTFGWEFVNRWLNAMLG